MNLNQYKLLVGDASYRKFYRNKKNKSIIVYSKKEKRKNLLIYDAINKLFNKNNINAPKLISENYSKNYIEIEDLGNRNGLKIFKRIRLKNYEKLFKILEKFKKIKNKNATTFKNTNYRIPHYSNNLILNEAKLFVDWYLPLKIKKNRNKIRIEFIKVIKNIVKEIKLKKKVIVHRDFHISNIMILKDRIYVIDNQDVVYGNQTYDLASLIDDVRIQTKLSFRENIYNKYILGIKKSVRKKFRNDFEILSVLRNLKIIGIFTRLSIRDNKHSYTKMIPYAWKMINERRKFNKNFNELNLLLKKYFPKYMKF